jgi:hypothetical protein
MLNLIKLFGVAPPDALRGTASPGDRRVVMGGTQVG